jgi:hypothetical protein
VTFSLQKAVIKYILVCIFATYAFNFVHILGVQHVLATSRDPERLLATWTECQRRFSSKIHEYLEVLQLTKLAAEANGENLLRYYVLC